MDPTPDLQRWLAASKEGLIDWRRTRLLVITCKGESCVECRKLEGKKFTIQQVLAQMPLPVKGCTHERGCRCCYGLHFSRGRSKREGPVWAPPKKDPLMGGL